MDEPRFLDPRHGDLEDDAAAPKAKSLLAIAGTYLDHVVRTPEGWRFQQREILNDVAGDLGLKR